jgi:hypothetical protein
MTRDRETADAELIYSTAERLWNDAQAQPGEDRASVEDLAIAHETGVELDEVREWLDEADGVRFEIGKYGDTRTVVAPIRP